MLTGYSTTIFEDERPCHIGLHEQARKLTVKFKYFKKIFEMSVNFLKY
jgi:hypothetical protein